MEAAAVDRVERVRELERFALRRLPSLQLADGVFCHQVRADAGRPEGRSLRYTLIVLIGLLRAEEHDIEHPFHLGAMRSRILSEVGSTELTPGDLGLALWSESRSGGDAVGELVDALEASLERNGLEGLTSMEVAWIVTGLTEAGARRELGSGERILARCREQLIEERRPRDGLVTHVARGRRKRLPHFADQIHSVQALSQLARIRDDDPALRAARSIGELLLANQMPNGAWPWIYDPLRGTVVEPYELYSMHQDSMAMIGMHGLSEASGDPRYREVAVRSLDWSYGGNELGAQMLDPDARDGLSLDSPQAALRARPSGTQRRRDLSARRTAPADPEELELNRSMRPHQLGWLLEAWAGREHLAGSDA